MAKVGIVVRWKDVKLLDNIHNMLKMNEDERVNKTTTKYTKKEGKN